MEKKVSEIVQRVNSWYVSDDCVQLMIPYKDAITILNKDGIVYHHKEGSNYFFVNSYVNDERRKQFPYHNIPTHYYKFFLGDKMHYTNQILEFEQPYIRVNDGHVIESYIIKDKNEALAVSKLLPINKFTQYMTRKELEELFKRPENINGSFYYLYLDGSMPLNKNNYNEPYIASEKEILSYVQGKLYDNRDYLKSCVNERPETTVGSYLRKNPVFFEFLSKSIDKLDLNLLKLELQLFNGRTILLIRTNGIDISVHAVDVYFVNYDCYKVDGYELPITKYTLDRLKYLSPKIEIAGEPKIPLKYNPGVSKEDIKREKKLVLEKKKHKIN